MTDLPPFDLPKPDLGPWRAGNTGVEGVWRFESGEPGPEVLVTALIHGNELCGAWAVLAALQVGLKPRRGALTLAFCNLAAFDRFERESFSRSRCVEQDLNRVWGAMPWRDAPTTLEQRRALQLLPFAERADWLLDLHSMHEPGPPLVLTGLAPRHVALARRIGTPALVVADAGHAEGLRLRDHGRWGVLEPAGGDDGSRSLLIECGFHGDPAARAVALDMLGRFLVAAGTVDELDVPGGWWRPVLPLQQVLEVTQAVTAKAGAVPPSFTRDWASGERIESAGTVIGFDGEAEIVAPYDGCTLIMPSLRAARPGATLVRLARDAAGG